MHRSPQDVLWTRGFSKHIPRSRDELVYNFISSFLSLDCVIPISIALSQPYPTLSLGKMQKYSQFLQKFQCIGMAKILRVSFSMLRITDITNAKYNFT